MRVSASRSQIAFAGNGCVGLDFGTTNSAIATVVDSRATLAAFPSAAGVTHTFPSVLYFERRREEARTRIVSAAGPAAIERYLGAEEKGRLIQSLKAYLADRRFDGTGVYSQLYTLQDMIALILHHLLAGAAQSFANIPRASSRAGPCISQTRATRRMMSSRLGGCDRRFSNAGSKRLCSSTSRWRPPTATSRAWSTTSSS